MNTSAAGKPRPVESAGGLSAGGNNYANKFPMDCTFVGHPTPHSLPSFGHCVASGPVAFGFGSLCLPLRLSGPISGRSMKAVLRLPLLGHVAATSTATGLLRNTSNAATPPSAAWKSEARAGIRHVLLRVGCPKVCRSHRRSHN